MTQGNPTSQTIQTTSGRNQPNTHTAACGHNSSLSGEGTSPCDSSLLGEGAVHNKKETQSQPLCDCGGDWLSCTCC